MKYLRLSLRATTAVLASLLAAQGVKADESIDALRAELGALKAQYEARIEALEQRLDSAEQQLAREQQPPAEPVESYAAVPAPAAAATSYASAGNEFNPAMGVILNGAYRAYDKNPEDYYVPGLPSGGGLADEGFSIGESEFVFTANVDDWFYGRVTAAVEQEDNEFSTSLEEAYLDTLSLPASTTLRFGRFYSSIGYLNDKHPHSWDFADQALPYGAFLDTQYGDDGIQLRWLAPTDLYVELGAEVFRGASYPAAGDAHNGRGTQSLFGHIGGDVGISNSWTAGLSWLSADARDRDSGGEDDPLSFDGTTEIYYRRFCLEVGAQWQQSRAQPHLPDRVPVAQRERQLPAVRHRWPGVDRCGHFGLVRPADIPVAARLARGCKGGRIEPGRPGTAVCRQPARGPGG